MKIEITRNLYNLALSRIEELLPKVSDDTPLDSPLSIELVLMSDIVEEYEKKHYPISKPAFNEVIKLRLEEENMKKQDFARQIGVSPNRVSEYLSGKAEPSLRTARLICQTLNIKADIALGMAMNL